MKRKELHLLPCPFCGAEAEIFYYIGNLAIRCPDAKCIAHHRTNINIGFEKEIEAWNKRTSKKENNHKPLYADAIAYFEKLEKKHDYQANKAKWQGRSEQEIENIQRKKEYARMAAEALRQMEG